MHKEAFKPISALELLQKEFPPIEYFLEPILFPGSVSMLYAHPGVGKSYMALWMVAAASCAGKFLKWQSHRRCNVLYIDSELPQRVLQARLKFLVVGCGYDLDERCVEFLGIDSFRQGFIPNMADRKNLIEYDKTVSNYDIVVIDNLCGAIRPEGKQSEQDAWLEFLPFLVRWRTRGKSVLLVHHAGKSGAQLGSSMKEQPLNTKIVLRRPFDYRAQDGARFEIHFEKDRDFGGDLVSPLEVRYRTDGNAASWEYAELEALSVTKVVELKSVGMTANQIAEALTMPLFLVKKLIRESKDAPDPFVSAMEPTELPDNYEFNF